jgi:hypothetical protein
MSDPILLLAQTRTADSIFNNMGSSLRDRNGIEWLTFLKLLAMLGGVLLTVGLTIFLLVKLLRLWRRTRVWLFLRLCRAHRLGWTDRWLLWRVARHLSPGEPAHVFVEPICLEDATALAALFVHTPRLLNLRARLFAGAEDLPEDLTLAAPLPPAPAVDPMPSLAAPRRMPDRPSLPLDDVTLGELLSPPNGPPALGWPNTPLGGGQPAGVS